MRLPYERPEAEVIDFRALETLATDATDPAIDLDPTSGIGGTPGVEDWNWSGN